MFANAFKSRWASDDEYSGLPIRSFSGHIPQKSSFNLTSRSEKSTFDKIFEAREIALCPSSNLEFDNMEHVALIYQIGSQCSTVETRNTKVLRAKLLRRRRRVFAQKPGVAVIGVQCGVRNEKQKKNFKAAIEGFKEGLERGKDGTR